MINLINANANNQLERFLRIKEAVGKAEIYVIPQLKPKESIDLLISEVLQCSLISVYIDTI